MREPAVDQTPPQKKLLEDVGENGLHIAHVPETDELPEYSYTVGMWHSFEQPEVVVFGLPKDVADELLNALADDAAEGKTFLAGSKHDGVLVGYPARFLGVPAEQATTHLPLVAWAYEDAATPAVQLVWPDKQGRWPWDPDVRQGFAAQQPVIGTRA